MYTRAAAKLDEWIAAKILVQDRTPSIYVYAQDYLVPGTQTRRTRIGFIALGRVEDYSAGVVFPHERTHTAPKADRIELLRHMRAQTGQLFMLYDDASRKIETLLKILHDEIPRSRCAMSSTCCIGSGRCLMRIRSGRIETAMAPQKLVIADGHHRYETALNFRNANREKAAAKSERSEPNSSSPLAGDKNAAYEFAMMTFISTHSKGLTILPTHRWCVIWKASISSAFAKASRPISTGIPTRSRMRRSARRAMRNFGAISKGRIRAARGRCVWITFNPTPTTGAGPSTPTGANAFYLFLLRRDVDLEQLLPDLSEGAAREGLDVVLLHRVMLERGLGITAEAVEAEKFIAYEREMDKAIAAVDRGEAQMACLLKPVRVEQVTEIALEAACCRRSPGFYPKLLSGETIFRIEGRVGSPSRPCKSEGYPN